MQVQARRRMPELIPYPMPGMPEISDMLLHSSEHGTKDISEL